MGLMHTYVHFLMCMSVCCLFKLVLIAKKGAAKLNSLPKGKIAVNVTPSPVNITVNISLVL